MTGSRSIERRWGMTSTYIERLLATHPIAYWPMHDTDAVCHDYNNPARNGTHTGVSTGQPGIGDNFTSCYYDGINDYTNIYTANLASVFNSQELSMMAWVRVPAAVWTDGLERQVIRLVGDNYDYADQVRIGKPPANGRLFVSYVGQGVSKYIEHLTISEDDICMGITVSNAADEVKMYVDGAQGGVTLNAVTPWTQNLGNGVCFIGSSSAVPNEPWHGYIMHVAIWDYPLDAQTMAALAIK